MNPVHPSLRSFAEMLGPGMDLSAQGIAATRALVDEVAAGSHRGDDPSWRVRSMIAESGGRSVETTVAGPVSPEPHRVLVWVHGGGFVTGCPEQDVGLLHELCSPTGTVAVAVRYRLAPEADIDDMVADVRTALAWAGASWPDAELVLGGESAGGALAVNALLDGSGAAAVDALVLLYPMLDPATTDPGHSTWVWSAANSRDAWTLAGADHARSRPPARREDFRALPPTHLEYGALDVLAAEAARFAGHLRRCGVPLAEHVTPGAVHGFAHAGPGPLVDGLLERLRGTLAARAGAGR